MRIRVGVAALALSALFLTCGYTPSMRGDDSVPGLKALQDPTEQHRCLYAVSAAQKWVVKLKLSDWDISLVCGVPKEWADRSEGLHGASQIDAPHRTGIVWFNPKSEKDPELVMIHELTHFVLQQAVESNSLMVQEQAVYLLSELMYKGRNL